MRDAFYPKLRLHPERDARLIQWWHSLPPSERAAEWRRVLHWALDLIESGWVPGVVVPFAAVRTTTNTPVARRSAATGAEAPEEAVSPGHAEPQAAPQDDPAGVATVTSADPQWGALLAELE